MENAEIKEVVRGIIADHEAKEFAFDEEVRAELRNLSGDLQSARQDLASFTVAGRLLWGLIGIFLASLGGLLGYAFARIDQLDDQVNAVHAQLDSFEARGTKWGEALDEQVLRIDSELRELRRKLNGGRHYEGN